MVLPETLFNQRIVFSALNWGMGHISRCLPLLTQLQRQGNQITLFCSEKQQKVFEEYLNLVNYYPHADYPFKFPEHGFSTLQFLRTIPRLYMAHRKEQRTLNEYIQNHSVDCILSDQRYGFKHPDVLSIFITHQCQLALPWYLKMGQYLNRKLRSKFNQIWVLDDPQIRLAGKLSELNSKNEYYIGLHSRFSTLGTAVEKKYVVCLLNGPQSFHPLLIEYSQSKGIKIDFIIGENTFDLKIPTLDSWKKADEILIQAKLIISFCGYSTWMDILALKCEWVCIPTPGQWEQEYLFKKKALAEPSGLHYFKNLD